MRCLGMVDGLLAKLEQVEAGELQAADAAARRALQLELTVQAEMWGRCRGDVGEM